VRDIAGRTFRRTNSTSNVLSGEGIRRSPTSQYLMSPVLPSNLVFKGSRNRRISSIQEGASHMFLSVNDHYLGILKVNDRNSSGTQGSRTKELCVGMTWDEESRVLAMKVS
jgi:hypothetical protein